MFHRVDINIFPMKMNAVCKNNKEKPQGILHATSEIELLRKDILKISGQHDYLAGFSAIIYDKCIIIQRRIYFYLYPERGSYNIMKFSVLKCKIH